MVKSAFGGVPCLAAGAEFAAEEFAAGDDDVFVLFAAFEFEALFEVAAPPQADIVSPAASVKNAKAIVICFIYFPPY